MAKSNFMVPPLNQGQPLRGRPKYIGMLDDAFLFSAPQTGRFSSSRPNMGAWPSGRASFKIPLFKVGKRWRMSADNRTYLINPGYRGKDWRPFASRGAALKYCRKLWSARFVRVQLVDFGLLVTLYQPDYHMINAIEGRCSRYRAKHRAFGSLYSSSSTFEADFSEIEKRLIAERLKAFLAAPSTPCSCNQCAPNVKSSDDK